MAPRRHTSWRLDLLLFLMLIALAVDGYLIWDRRAPWHVVETVKGSLPSYCEYSPTNFIRDVDRRTLFFPDTGLTYRFPEGRIPSVEVISPDRRFGINQVGTKSRLWDFVENREIPIPEELQERWWLSADWTRLLLMDEEAGHLRQYLVCSMDGAVLRRLVLPADPPKKDANSRVRTSGSGFSEQGNFMIELTPVGDPPGCVRIHEMETGKSWLLEGRPIDVLDDGLVVLTRPAPAPDGATGQSLCGFDLRTGTDGWTLSPTEGIDDIWSPGSGCLLARTTDKAIVLLDGRTGRRRFALEGGSSFTGTLSMIRIFNEGSRRFLDGGVLWSLEDGHKLPYKRVMSFFPDQRTGLRTARMEGGRPEIIDLETGRTLFRFETRFPVAQPGYACRSGNKVLSYADKNWGSVLVWERRHREGWKGHLTRPEVLIAFFLGAAIGLLWLSRPRPQAG